VVSKSSLSRAQPLTRCSQCDPNTPCRKCQRVLNSARTYLEPCYRDRLDGVVLARHGKTPCGMPFVPTSVQITLTLTGLSLLTGNGNFMQREVAVELSGFLGTWDPGTGQLPNTVSVMKSTEDSSPTKIQGLRRAQRPSVPGRTHTDQSDQTANFYASRCASI
jgi:hypothetical protein